MDEMQLLLAEAGSMADEMLASVEQAHAAPSPDDAREAIRAAIRSGEEMRNRLEEALDYAQPGEEVWIEAALSHLEDSLDAGQVALMSEDPSPHFLEMGVKLQETLLHLAPPEDIEAE